MSTENQFCFCLTFDMLFANQLMRDPRGLWSRGHQCLASEQGTDIVIRLQMQIHIASSIASGLTIAGNISGKPGGGEGARRGEQREHTTKINNMNYEY